MRLIGLGLACGVLLGVAACGGPVELSCDEVRAYQLAQPGKRIVVPDGLDELDTFREMPVPEPSPRPERPPGSPCLDMPPAVNIGE
jgi:hypothetical protein